MDLGLLTKTLLEKRGLKSKQEIAEFFSPTAPEHIVSPFDSTPALRLIKEHIKKHHKIAIYGDYDVDGICSTAILWETLHQNYSPVFPHIPHRESEGYGLSNKGIDLCLAEGAKLIITVDNGIVADDEVAYCRKNDCDIIIIDHHEPAQKLPDANVILHSTITCAAGLTWFFCRDFQTMNDEPTNYEQLSLVSIAVICDIVPLLGVNRSFAKYGLEELNKAQRPGLRALFNEAAISKIGTYEVGFIIGPRLNAMGRLEHAIDSLRLLCTRNPKRARGLAMILGETNKARQDQTQSAVRHALDHVDLRQSVLMVADVSYPQGVIGLIAGKLAEKYYRPAIAVSVGEVESKASARSIPGFHITEHIRTASHLLLGAGGHAMAAGFTVETGKLAELTTILSQVEIAPELLLRKSRVDAEIPLSTINSELLTMIKSFEPFGLGNPRPVFKTSHVTVSSSKKMGKSLQHTKLQIDGLEAVAFNISEIPANPVDIEYTVDENTWNDQTKLQLMIKDIKSAHG